MKYYAYIPREDGTEPLGTSNRIVFELKTDRGAYLRSYKTFKTTNFKLFTYTNFYDESTFKQIETTKRIN